MRGDSGTSDDISIHAPPRGATRAWTPALHRRADFNSRPSARGDGSTKSRSAAPHDFNSRPSARGDEELQALRYYPRISIHAPPRGATIFEQCGKLLADFNSRPSARGDVGKVLRGVQSVISIHAPPRGATLRIKYIPLYLPISIHAPPRGATRSNWQRIDGQSISIHAPPRGATNRLPHIHRAIAIFQFTPLREGRRNHATCEAGKKRYFNSRPSARGDLPSVIYPFSVLVISIHAPPRGATQRKASRMPHRRYFNSRPSARGDIGTDGTIKTKLISIHAPPRGATDFQKNRKKIKKFQFTPLREGRLRCFPKSCTSCRFQFTPLREGRRNIGGFPPFRNSFQFTPLREGRRQPP